ncbi:MAG: class I SAM-dependent methyltransferase, partial [Actinobacteria bacterium]|nr:class I SAM-dependent methyltransferase [Actinomycetota bacterium]
MSDESIVFDRAAEYYDRTRSLPADVQARVTDVLSAELSGRGACLEPGVGTGRIALPLHERGIPMVGADLSLPMMARLVENAGGQVPFPLLRADATCLPFGDDTFGAAYVCHVFHLIPNWRRAAAEMARVVRRGGVVIVNLGGPPTSMGAEIFQELTRQAGDQGLRPGAT